MAIQATARSTHNPRGITNAEKHMRKRGAAANDNADPYTGTNISRLRPNVGTVTERFKRQDLPGRTIDRRFDKKEKGREPTENATPVPYRYSAANDNIPQARMAARANGTRVGMQKLLRGRKKSRVAAGAGLTLRVGLAAGILFWCTLLGFIFIILGLGFVAVGEVGIAGVTIDSLVPVVAIGGFFALVGIFMWLTDAAVIWYLWRKLKRVFRPT